MRFPDFNDDWTQCCISDYGDIVTGSTPSTSDPENYQENGFLWASPADINESKFIEATKTTLSLKGFNSTRKLPPYTVLVVCIGSTIGKMAMSKTVMATNQQINSIVVCEKYSPEFVYYAIDSRFPQYLTSVAVQAVPIISKSTFGALESCAPSLTEQKKIADFLSLIDERIQSCSETIKELKTQKAGLLNQLFSQKLRFPDFTDEWTQTTLGEILDYEQPTFYIVNNTDYSNDSSLIPVLTANKSFVLGYVNEENIYDKGECIILDDFTLDIKFVDFPFKIKSSAIKILTAKKGVNIKIIYNYLLFMNLRGQEKDHKRHYISEVQPLSISLPTLEEQKKIADFLSLIDERIEVEEQLLKKYEEQKKYLLRQMFV
ncbi:restriction endonuclease subunit S [Porphyromonas canoris]|uniref:restriction endonuclease subunit S n=1 Tax=Porphyromonas canoris TaxID=36875 RepID=UPI0009DCAE4C|nr:restriction endonuclease subunit S [Porphyromonas canoris]